MLTSDSKIKCSVFYSICVLMFMYYTVCYFTGIFHAVVRHISMLFIDNKDSVFCKVQSELTGGELVWPSRKAFGW